MLAHRIGWYTYPKSTSAAGKHIEESSEYLPCKQLLPSILVKVRKIEENKRGWEKSNERKKEKSDMTFLWLVYYMRVVSLLLPTQLPIITKHNLLQHVSLVATLSSLTHLESLYVRTVVLFGFPQPVLSSWFSF